MAGKEVKSIKNKLSSQEGEWKVPGYSSHHGHSESKHDSSSTSSFFSCSNLTTSCSGVEEHDEKEPSTSGCSSFLAYSQNISNKNKKKERVKEYLKELKSMVQPQKHSGSRMGTLSTLQHVLTSMRKIKEAKQKSKEEVKTRTTVEKEEQYSTYSKEMMHTFYESDSHESLTSESLKCNVELRIILTPNDHIVRTISNNMKYMLGYPKESWIGRSLDDYVHKKDLITFNSFHKSISESEDNSDLEAESKIFYFRLRKFKSLGQSGFSLRKQDNFMPFQCTFTRKLLSKSELKKQEHTSNWYDESSTSGISASLGSGSQPTVSEDLNMSPTSDVKMKSMSQDEPKLYTILYCVPLVSPYVGLHLPEINTFETRHTLFCGYCHVQPNTIPLLGYLPQEMIGVSIFDFYHNDDLKALYNIYQKVIALKSVPYKSGPIRLLAKNGSWVTVVTEWSSFVNPWSKRLEFIIGKHEVVSGPENANVFSENFHMSTLEDPPEHVLQARQKIKDLLLQPVETVYVGSSPDMGASKTKKNKSGKTVAIAEYLPSQRDVEGARPEQDTMYQEDPEKTCTHTGGVLFKESSIGQAYEQLNYTNCIKKFLLSQPLTFSSESDAKKSSSEDGADMEEEKQNRSLPRDFWGTFGNTNHSIQGSSMEKWLARNLDDIVVPKNLYKNSAESCSLPALNDEFWKKRIIPSDSNFEFDISVPKPPSFGSSTKVLVSEQEHRDNETSLDPISLREQLQIPISMDTSLSGTMHSQQREPHMSTTDSPPIMTLTRESLWKHTLLQEQLYIATASPDRNILFMNQEKDNQCFKPQKRQSLKRSHSPDATSSTKLKSSRHSEAFPVLATSASILNPSFSLLNYENKLREEQENSKSTSQMSNSQMMFPMKMYPIVSLCQSPPHSEMMSIDQNSTASSKMQQWSFLSMPGMPMAPQMMMGFHQTKSSQQCMPQRIGTPIPVNQLNSYLMQQANMMTPISTSRSRKKLELKKNKNLLTSSSDDSFEETSSSLYLLEDQPTKMSQQLIMQSLAQQLSHNGLSPAPWLENLCFMDNLQLKYHMMKNKHKRVLKKDREFIEKATQPDIAMMQLDQLLGELEDNCPEQILDMQQDYLFTPPAGRLDCCSMCMKQSCCKNWVADDHGISSAMQLIRKSGKKEKRGKKQTSHGMSNSSPANIEMAPLDTSENRDFGKMEVDTSSSQCSTELLEIKGKTENTSSKSDSGEGIDSSESVASLNSCSEMTPSDQRSNNENGSSMKESDADAMSKKSDSSSSDKQQSSESESETKRLKYLDLVFEKMFTSLNICFPNMHRNSVPWLLEVDFTDDLKYTYRMEKVDNSDTLLSDLTQLNEFYNPSLVHEQLTSLFNDAQGIRDPTVYANCSRTYERSESELTNPDHVGQRPFLTRNPEDFLTEFGPDNGDDDEVLKSLFTCL